MATKLFASRSETIAALESALNPFEQKILAMYNSRISGIIKDPLFMSIAIDDHMVHRGHAVFDTVSIINGKAYNLKRHLRRIVHSAELAKIDLPHSPAILESILLDLAASTNERNLFIRYWASSGPGSMAIYPVPNSSTFYAMAYISDAYSKFSNKSEHFVSVPLKPKLLANMKSNNYLLNALCCMESRQNGGEYGIQLTSAGKIAEGSVNNIAFVINNTFVTPSFDLILNGTTIERVLCFAEKLVQEGLLAGVEQRDVSAEEVKNSQEAFNVGGDSITGLLSINNQPIGTGDEGPICKRLKEMLKHDFENPDLCIDVPYLNYN